MNNIVASLTQLGKEIEKIANAFYDEQPERKTLKYLKEKQDKLEEIWQKFDALDSDLRTKHATELAAHQYTTSDYYNIVKKNYDRILQVISELIKVVEKHNQEQDAVTINKKGTVSNDQNTLKVDEDVMKLIRNQRQSMRSLDKLLDKILSVVEIQSKAYYVVKRELIQENWKNIEMNQKLIWEKNEDLSVYSDEQYVELREKYQEVLIKIEEEQGGMANNHNITTQMKLPKIQLPKFDGNYLKWQQFCDLYTQMIHLQDMGNAQKMFYLKSNLTGEAEKLIRHISISDENYQAAWDILCNRYANKRLLVSALIDKLLSQPTISNESAATIKMLHDTTKECIVGLENLGLKVYGSWDSMMLHILTRKIDRNTHNLYEQSLKAPRELQSIKQFLEFLELRFQALEALGH